MKFDGSSLFEATDPFLRRIICFNIIFDFAARRRLQGLRHLLVHPELDAVRPGNGRGLVQPDLQRTPSSLCDTSVDRTSHHEWI